MRGEEKQHGGREEAQENMLYGLVHRSGSLQPLFQLSLHAAATKSPRQAAGARGRRANSMPPRRI
jgi:hypothetical protein